MLPNRHSAGQWLRTFIAVTALLTGAGNAAEPPPVVDFFRYPDFVDMVMSPDGQAIAATVRGKQGRVGLVILDPRDLTRSKSIARYDKVDVYDVQWVNDKRLLYRLSDEQVAYVGLAPRGLWGIDVEGKEEPRALVLSGLRALLRDGSDNILSERNAYFNTGEWRTSHLLRVNARTGENTNMSLGEPERVFFRAFDTNGVTRALFAESEGKTILHWRTAVDQPWTKVREFDTFGADGPPSLMMVDSQDRLFIVGRASGERDTAVLMRLDMRDPNAKPVTVLGVDGYDFDGSLVTDGRGNVLGVRYLNDARGTHWFSSAMAQVQRRVDALLPSTNNLIECGLCEKPSHVLVKAASDRQPTMFLLFDVESGSLKTLASSRPWINPASMARRDLVRITARDGLSIPVHVTKPLGQRDPAPMVVLVHGGPWIRGGEWEWEAQSQFLASRGYVVIEPEFRGSTGFGEKLYRAGFKQWGLAMQDDIADATRWAINQAYADPKRVCIAGASYGGYATLMGLIRYPELYRCGVEWVGVTDIDLMYSVHWSDLGEDYLRQGMPVLVGDRAKDAAQLAATSPIRLATKLRQPLLMAYGELDRRVPLVHGEKMRDALRAAGNPPEWIVYDGEGHGWWLQADNFDFWTRVERFLARNLTDAR